MFEDIITGIDDIINDINEVEEEESWDAGNGPWTTGQKADIWSTGQGSCGGQCGDPDANCDKCEEEICDDECDICDGCIGDCETCDDVNVAPDGIDTGDPFPLATLNNMIEWDQTS